MVDRFHISGWRSMVCLFVSGTGYRVVDRFHISVWRSMVYLSVSATGYEWLIGSISLCGVLWFACPCVLLVMRG